MEALSRVLDGRRRPWDPKKEPTLTAYLKSVVRSILSEIQKAAERESGELAAVDREGRDLVAAGQSTDAGADLELERAQLEEEILGAFEGDENQLVLLCLFTDLVKPSEIAEETGLSVPDVYRIKRKIKRRLSHLQEGG
jgi:DNA-directed RNA polymerase specialized sigma subunit